MPNCSPQVLPEIARYVPAGIECAPRQRGLKPWRHKGISPIVRHAKQQSGGKRNWWPARHLRWDDHDKHNVIEPYRRVTATPALVRPRMLRLAVVVAI